MIDLKNIGKAYDNYQVLVDFNYQFEFGKSYALIGKSGSGKTTLLNIIGRLEVPNDGEVLIQGKSIKDIPERIYFKDYLGYLFQNYGLIDNESIKDNLKLAFIGRKDKISEQDQLINQALKKVGLAGYDVDRKIFSLSGGEAQRVAIAKLLIKRPPIVLADEPTGSLDEETSKEIMDMLLGIVTENTMVIIATHDAYVYNRVDNVISITN